MWRSPRPAWALGTHLPRPGHPPPTRPCSFPRLEKSAKQAGKPPLIKALMVVDPVLDPISKGFFKMVGGVGWVGGGWGGWKVGWVGGWEGRREGLHGVGGGSAGGGRRVRWTHLQSSFFKVVGGWEGEGGGRKAWWWVWRGWSGGFPLPTPHPHALSCLLARTPQHPHPPTHTHAFFAACRPLRRATCTTAPSCCWRHPLSNFPTSHPPPPLCLQTEESDLHYGAFLLLAVSSTLLEIMVGEGGLLVGAVPSLDLLYGLREVLVFQVMRGRGMSSWEGGEQLGGGGLGELWWGCGG